MRNKASTPVRRAVTDPIYRKRFESLVECSIQGIVVHRNRRILFANTTFARMFGVRNPAALVGTDPNRFIAPDDRARVVSYGAARRAGKPAPERYEFRANHPSGRPMWVEARATLVEWDGAQATLAALVDITDRKQAEERLLVSEERFRNLVEGSLEGVNVLQGDKLVFVNQAFADIFGYRDPAHVLRYPRWERFQAPWERRRMAGYARNRIRGLPAPPRYEFQGLRLDGKVIWLEASVRRILWQGQPALQGTLIDITERKRVQEALAESQNLLRTVVDTVPQALFAKDRQGRYLLVNRKLSAFYGLEPHEVVGRKDTDLPGALPRQAARFRAEDRHVLRTGKPLHRSEVFVIDHARKPHWYSQHKLPLRDASGHIIGVVGVSEDVALRRQAEEESRQQRLMLEAVLDAIPYPVSYKDRERRIRLVNRAFIQAWRKPASEFVGKRVNELPDVAAGLAAGSERVDERVLRTGQRMDVPEMRFQIGGRDVIRRVIKVPVKDGRGRVTGVVTLSEDITARRRAEEALIVSKRLLDQILANIPVGLSLVDKDLNVIAANERFYELLGFPKSMQRTAKTFADYVRYNAKRGEYGPGDVEELVAERVTLAKKFEPHRFERVRPGGPALEITGNPLPGGGFITTYMDITERRHAQEQLLANRRLLQTVLDSLPHFLTVKDAQGRYLLVNRAFAAFWNQPQEAFLGRRPGELAFIPREYLNAITESDQPALRQGEAIDSVTREITIADRTIFQRVIKLPVRGENGRIEGVVTLVEDVTAQRKADEDLRASRRLLQMIFDVIPVNLFVKDTESRFIMANRAQCAFYGLTAEQFAGLPTERLPGMHPDLLAHTLAYDRQVLEKGVVTPVDEYQRVNAAGEMRWLRGIKLPLTDDSGKIIGLLGMAEDITEAKQAQAALEESRRLLQILFDTIPHDLFVKNRDGTFVMVNNAMARFHGLTPREMVGLHTHALPQLTVEQREALLEGDRKVLETRARVDSPAVLFRNFRGEEHWRHIIKLPLLNEHGEVTGIVGVGEDVTERKRREEELWSSRELLRTVFDTIPTYLIVKDRHARFVMVNAAAARFEGLPADAFPGMSTDLLPRRDAETIAGIKAVDQRVLEHGEPVDVGEYTRIDAQGQRRFLRARKLPLRDAQGRVNGLLGVIEDVTEQKLALQQLEANRRLLQTVFDAIPLRIAVRDAEGRYMAVNRRMAEDHQMPPAAFIGQQLWPDKSQPPEEQERSLALVQQVLESRRTVVTPELSITLPGGNRRLIRSTLVPLFDAQGALQGVLGIGEDITERKKSELALLQAQKLESLGVLAGGVAHDFNNLLVTIMGNASLALLKLPPGNGPQEELQQIELAGQRAAELCRQMLSYAGKGRMEKQPVNLNQLVQEMTQLLRVSLPKGVTVNFHLTQNPPLTEADPTQLRQVVMNLVINAGEAIGEKPGTIVIATGMARVDKEYLLEAHADLDTPEGEYVFLEVSDTGVGMDAETRARIFDPFFTTKFAGRGLGLASVLGIVRGHRGGLKVYSEPGKGTSFKVLLPVTSGAAVAAPRSGPAGDWSGGGTVLVIDDEPSIRAVAVKMLARLGFRAIEAPDGAAALEIVRNSTAPLTAALLDLTMPGLSGEETLRRLRRIDKRLPIILMSGYNEREVLDRFVGRELAGFLQKPFKLDDLRDRLRELFRQAGLL
jgi:PAS domain S-box-containing protein